MELIKITVALATLCLFPVTAHASNQYGGHITSYLPQSGGQMFFTSDGPRDSVPGCAAQDVRWVIDDTTPAGQALVAGLLTAYALHKTVDVVGTGNCSVSANTETVAYFGVS